MMNKTDMINKICNWEEKFQKAKETKDARLLMEVMDEQAGILELKRKTEALGEGRIIIEIGERARW